MYICAFVYTMYLKSPASLQPFIMLFSGCANGQWKDMHHNEILECETFTYGKHHFPWHLHPNYWSFSLTVGGSAKLIFAGQTFTVTAGDIVIIPPLSPHRTVVEDFFTYKIIRVAVAHPALGRMSRFNGHLLRDRQAVAVFHRWHERLKESGSAGLAGGFPESFRPYLPGESFGPDTAHAPLGQALAYMHENFSAPVQLEDLSRAAFLSSSHFQRRFKQEFAISPMRYIQSLRIDKAKELIIRGNTMTEVALATGFYDQSHFNKYFKMLVGMRPSAYSAVVRND